VDKPERQLSKLERLCYERIEREHELARGGHPRGFTYDAAAGDYAVRWVEKYCRHHKGKWKGQRLILADWQRWIFRNVFGWKRPDGTRRFRQVWQEVPKKNGKALALDTPIPTPNGWTTMGSLRVGDPVFDERGRVCRVTFATDVQFDRTCYRVMFSDRTSIVADAEHLWFTESRRTGLPHTGLGPKSTWEARHIRTTEQIRASISAWPTKKSVYWNHRIPCADPLQLPSIDLIVPPYTLGVWLGDGNTNEARLTCGREDVYEMRDLLFRDGTSLGPARRDPRSSAYSFGIGIRTTFPLRARLRAIGVLGAKHIPQQYLRASEEQRMALLQGLMDTDGHATPRGQCEFTTTRLALLDGFVELARSLGFKPMIKAGRAMLRGKDCGPKYRVQFWSFSDRPVFRLRRKVARLKQRIKDGEVRSSVRQIVEVDPVDSVPVRCIQVDSPSHLYLAGRGMVPTHNTETAAGTGVFLMTGDNEPGAEVYMTATAKEQASICHKAAREMVKQSPELSQFVTVPKREHGNLVCASLGSKMQILSSDFGTQDGLSPHGDIRDEVHAWKDHELDGVLSTAMGARAQPLTVEVTTAGVYDKEGVGWQHHDDAQFLLENPEHLDDRKFIFISGMDEGDDPYDPATWWKANPNLGVSLYPDFIAEQANEAKRNPRKYTAFLQYHLNVWTSVVSRWFNMERWRECPSKPLDLEKLRGALCFGGLDLSRTTDLTAFVLVFILPNNEIALLPRFWLPQEKLDEELKKKGQSKFKYWMEAGLLVGTPGASVDYQFIEKQVKEDNARFKPKEIGYDRYNADRSVSELQAAGLPMVEVAQGPLSLSAACKFLEGAVLNRRVHHGGHAVLTWCFGNAVPKVDSNGNISPDKARSRDKIDGVSASVTALSRYMPFMPKTGGSYLEHGNLVVLDL